MSALRIELLGLPCWVQGPHVVLSAVRAYFAPAQCSDRVDDESVVVHIVAHVDSDLVRAAVGSCGGHAGPRVVVSHPHLRYYCQDLHGVRVLLPEHGPPHVIRVAGSHPGLTIHVSAFDHSALARVTRRVLRALVLRGAEAAGGGSVHAGTVRLARTGLLVGGKPGSGKTSVITALIEAHGAQPVSNDRTAVVGDAEGAWTAHGVPLAWRYAPEGLSGSVRLSHAITTETLRRGRDLVDGKIELTLEEIGRHLRSVPLPATQLNRVVVLQRCSPDARPVGPLNAADHLTLDPDQFADDWLDLRSRLGARPTSCLPERLTRLMDTSVMSWRDPAELAPLARRVAREALR